MFKWFWTIFSLGAPDKSLLRTKQLEVYIIKQFKFCFDLKSFPSQEEVNKLKKKITNKVTLLFFHVSQFFAKSRDIQPLWNGHLADISSPVGRSKYTENASHKLTLFYLQTLQSERPDSLYLWSAICFKIMTRYTCGFFPRILAIIPATRSTCVFLSRILAFYSQVYDHFLTNAHIYDHKENHIYALQTSMWYMRSQKVVV